MDSETNVYGQILKWMNMPLIHIGETPLTLGGIAGSFFIVLAALFISAIIQRVITRNASARWKLNPGMTYALTRIIHYCILIAGAVLAAQCVGLNLGSFAVIFGFLSVGIGFGLQNVTSNFIAGLILLLERPINVGDMISVEGQAGVVIQINMRSTVIETFDRISIIVPNSKFIEGSVINWSHGDTTVRVHCPVGVAYGSDTAKVREVLLRVARENENVLKNPEPSVQFIKFGDSSLDFELLIWLSRPDIQKTVVSEINFAIDAAFREADIQIPFPQRDLHLKASPAVAEWIEKIKK